MTQRSRRWVPTLLGATVAVMAGVSVAIPTLPRAVSTSSGQGGGHPILSRATASATSSQVAYISDSTSGGSNLFSDDMGAAAPGGGANGSSGPYSTATPAAALTVTVTNQDASFLGNPTYPLTPYDTVVMYDICDVAGFPQYITNLNKFVDNGGKLIILDGGQCVNGNGGIANWNAFEKPFSDNYKLPDPQYGSSLPYTYVESGDPLTANLPDCGSAPCNEAGNAVSDASVISVASSGWCESLGGTDTNGVSGAVEAYTHNKAGSGLIVYEGEPFALSTGTHPSQKHLRLVFDGILGQSWNTDSLPCGKALGSSGSSSQPSTYVPVTPFRVWDTRSGSQVQCPGGCTLTAGGTHTVQISGQGTPPIPANATAIVANLTGVQPSQSTYLSIGPAGASGLGSSSNLNLNGGAIQANLTTVALSSSGQVTVFNSVGSVDAALDVQGYFLPATAPPPAHTIGTYHSISPQRVCDTRGSSPCTAGTLGPGQSRAITVTGTGGIPSDGTATAAAFNLTAVQGTSGTYLTASPPNADGTCNAQASSSSLNVNAGGILPNRVIVPIGTSGAAKGLVCIYNSVGSINFIIDTNGWFGSGAESTVGALFYPVTPVRICDTRSGSGTLQCAGQSIGAAGTLSVIGNVPAAPPNPVAIVVNATGILGSANTFLSLYPDGPQPSPLTSDLNPNAGQIIANLGVVGLSSGGKFDVFNAQGTIDVALDAQGWFA